MKWFKFLAGTGAMAFAFCTTHAQTAAGDKSLSTLYNAVKSETDLSRKEALVIEMENKTAVIEHEKDLINYSRSMVASAFAEKKNADKAAYWTGRISDVLVKDNTAMAVIRELTEEGALPEAEKLVKPLIEKYKKGQAPVASGSSFYQPLTVADLEAQYGVILYKKGAYKKALPLLTLPADAAGRKGDSRYRAEYYAMTLAKLGDNAKALDEMNKVLLAPGHRSAAFKEEAEKVFRLSYRNDIRYKQLVDSLALVDKQKMETKVAKLAVNDPAPDFTLTDINGKTVSLKNLRGKTVILDFWATWCQPCVASFPGMQKAVDYYQNDADVVFLFIHTAEHSEDPVGDVKRFMANKKYRFNIYMDLKDKTTGRNTVLDLYKVKSIPAKFVIDKEGIIRYKNTGYISEEEAIPEISTMVNSTRKPGNAQAQAGGDKISHQLKELYAIRDEAQLNERLNKLVNSDNEQDLLVAYSYYYYTKDAAKAEDVLQKGVQKFPKGDLVYTGLVTKASNEKDVTKKEALYETMLREYPDKKSAGFILYELATGFTDAGNKEKMWLYLSKLKEEQPGGAYHIALIRAASTDAVKGEPILKTMIDSLLERYEVLRADKDTAAKKIREQRSTLSLLNSGISSYSKALIENGKGEQAYQLMAKHYNAEAGNPHKTAYLNTLLATKRYKEAFPFIEDAMRANMASPEVKAKYRDAYIAEKGSAKGFEEHHKNLLLSIKDKIKQDVLKHAKNEPAPLFTLKDVDGNSVSLADLKGKVVVMDFWATWCGPCKASFPSMQLAVNKYKDDPKVKFVFIHTWEKGSGDAAREAKKYVVDNNYSFQVLMDLRDPQTKESNVASQYKVSGIPTKIIVDTTGNIRFSVSGFNSFAEVALEELSAMIEYAKGKS